MRRILLLLCFAATSAFAQTKRPLDHTVYDAWQSIGERILSPDGHWMAYTVDVQEGDGILYISSFDTTYKVAIARGYQAAFTADSRFAVFRIKPLYADIKQARIKKKKPEDSPKDSLGILSLGQKDVLRIARVKSYRLPEKDGDVVAYQMEPAPPSKPKRPTSPADLYFTHTDEADAPDDDAPASDKKAEGTELILQIGRAHV